MTMLEGGSPNRRTATVWTFIITDGIFFVNRFFVFIPPFYQKPAASHFRRRRFVFFIIQASSGPPDYVIPSETQ